MYVHLFTVLFILCELILTSWKTSLASDPTANVSFVKKTSDRETFQWCLHFTTKQYFSFSGQTSSFLSTFWPVFFIILSKRWLESEFVGVLFQVNKGLSSYQFVQKPVFPSLIFLVYEPEFRGKNRVIKLYYMKAKRMRQVLIERLLINNKWKFWLERETFKRFERKNFKLQNIRIFHFLLLFYKRVRDSFFFKVKQRMTKFFWHLLHLVSLFDLVQESPTSQFCWN